MSYRGSAALRLDNAQVREQRAPEREAPAFEVIEGGGLDARARRGVGDLFLSRVRLGVIAVCAVVAIGGLRVTLSAATVSALASANDLRTQVSAAEDANAALQIERSADSSSQRITRIATQNYGMVHATQVETLDLSEKDEEAEASTTQASAQKAGAAAAAAKAAGDASKTTAATEAPKLTAESAAARGTGMSDEHFTLAPGSDETDEADDADADGAASLEAGSNAVTMDDSAAE